MVKVRNKETGLEFDLEDLAAAELIRCNPLTFEIIKATKEALKMIDKAEIPTDEQRLLGEVKEVNLEEKYKDVEIIEEAPKRPRIMAKTFQEIQEDIAYIFRSTIDPDDMQLENQLEEEYLNVASSCYTEAMRLLNDNNFDFNILNSTIKTRSNRASYQGVNGQIIKNGVLVEGNTTALRYDANGNLLRSQTGRPSKFWLDNEENIILYPTPDAVYNVTVKFKDMRYFLDSDLVPQYEPQPTYTLRMPDRLQAPFIDWLKYETLANYIKNLSKPRYQPIINKAEQLRMAFLKLANGYKDEAYMSL